jgi:hypothetical protein
MPLVCRLEEISSTNDGVGPEAAADGNVEPLAGETMESGMLGRIETAVDAEVDMEVDVADMDAILNEAERAEWRREGP